MSRNDKVSKPRAKPNPRLGPGESAKPIHYRRFAFALASLIGLTPAARAQAPWEEQRRDEMRERLEHRDEHIREERREEQFARERAEDQHRREEHMRAEEWQRHHEEGRGDDGDRREFNR